MYISFILSYYQNFLLISNYSIEFSRYYMLPLEFQFRNTFRKIGSSVRTRNTMLVM